MLGRNGQNLQIEVKDDGVYFKAKKVATEAFKEALSLVKEKIMDACPWIHSNSQI